MQPTRSLPDLAIVRVLTPGGPYRAMDLLSLAFVEPTIGRLVAHAPNNHDVPPIDDALVPESISAIVIHAAPPYVAGLVLTLSFVDPGIARIHAPASDGTSEPTAMVPSVETTPIRAVVFDEPPSANGHVGTAYSLADMVNTKQTTHHTSAVVVSERIDPMLLLDEDTVDRESFENTITSSARNKIKSDVCKVQDASETLPRHALIAPATECINRGVEIRLEWTHERVRRFITVIDKLFTVERLGWYRHVLAMRLLVPDSVSCGDAPSDLEAVRHLRALRAASVETLGRPLLAAFMPSFTVTPQWLASIDSVSAARALAGVRDAIAPFVTDLGPLLAANDSPTWTIGRVDRHDFEIAPTASVEALLPILIANVSVHPLLTERLTEYRRTLIDVFSQTAQSAEAVRLGAMAQPNHSLDDRLWQLVGTVGETFGGLAVA